VSSISRSQAASILGKKGSRARMKKLSAAQRTAIARNAANARWKRAKRTPKKSA
jgi:hypothetical protein